MNYTYRQLLAALQELSQDELDMHVSVYDATNEEYYPLNYTGKCEGDDVVDADHPIMIINDPEATESEPIDEMFQGTREALDSLTIMDR